MTSVKFEYRNGPQEDNGIRMTRERIDANYSPRAIEEVCNQWRRFQEEDQSEMYPWAERFVMGFPLPEWQRPFVWTEEQQRSFIVSVWSRGDLGYYIVTDFELSDGRTYDRFSNLLLDGQQRMTTLERYLSDQVAVPDLKGVPRLWSEVYRREQRRFLNVVFTRGQVRTFDEHELRTIYDLRNFAGTPHDESQRALKS